jgi:hypothetical protein
MNGERLEQDALEERDHIEGDVRELVEKVSHASPRYKVEQHFAPIATAGFIVSFLFGFAIGSLPAGR